MTTREMADRRKARSLGMNEVLEEVDRTEEQYQCTTCKALCYLSQITCPCSSKVACVEHASLLCSQAHLTLRKRFTDEDILDTQKRISERAALPLNWKGKLSKSLVESSRPQLKQLKSILAEGERINYPLNEIPNLRKCVNRANEWVEAANSFIVRKPSRKRAVASRRTKGGVAVLDEVIDMPDRSLDDLYALLHEVETLGFDCPEIGSLQSLAQQAEDLKVKAAVLLDVPEAQRDTDDFLKDCQSILIAAGSLNVLVNEVMEVQKIVDRERLAQELEEKMSEGENSLTLEEVRQLLTRARTCDLSADNKYLRVLETRQRAGDNWEEKAKNVLAQPVKTIAELDDFENMDLDIPIDPTVLDRLMSARAKAKDFEKQAMAWLVPSPDSQKPRPQDVMRLVTRAEKDFSISAIKDLQKLAGIATDLETRCEHILKNRYRKAENEDIFETVEMWKGYAREHLHMFSLPVFEKLEIQLKQHYQWIRDLPWWCKEHNRPEGYELFNDVMESTRPEDDLPPSDEFFTCICNIPVRPPTTGSISDAVQCDHCFARFHGECAKNGGSCPFCDHHHWNGEIRKERNWHFCFLPPMQRNAPDITKHYCEDWKQLDLIVKRVERLCGVIGQFLSFTSQPDNQRVDYIHQVRHYMRKLYKIQFAVSTSSDISFGLDLAELHRILAQKPGPGPSPMRPRKRRRPRFTFGPDIDPDWVSDGSRCICRGRTDYLATYPKVRCEACNHTYHHHCVFYTGDPPGTVSMSYTCPLCSLRKNKHYPYAELRVIPR
jgi:[histone H3]-trimethyl-L-lysine4 demethylase